MDITQEVIEDLLPIYFSGEASTDTCGVVEEYFRRNPGFEIEARGHAQGFERLLHTSLAPLDPAAEKATLRRAKRILWWQKVLLALASTFTLNAISLGFSFEIGKGQFRIHWLALPGQRELIVGILLVSAVFWILYFRASHSVRKRVLG